MWWLQGKELNKIKWTQYGMKKFEIKRLDQIDILMGKLIEECIKKGDKSLFVYIKT